MKLFGQLKVIIPICVFILGCSSVSDKILQSLEPDLGKLKVYKNNFVTFKYPGNWTVAKEDENTVVIKSNPTLHDPEIFVVRLEPQVIKAPTKYMSETLAAIDKEGEKGLERESTFEVVNEGNFKGIGQNIIFNNLWKNGSETRWSTSLYFEDVTDTSPNQIVIFFVKDRLGSHSAVEQAVSLMINSIVRKETN